MAANSNRESENSNSATVSEILDTREIDDKVRKQVWKRLGQKSIRQIAADTGLKPEQVIEIKQQLLDEVDVLSLTEQRMKLMVTMHEMVELAKERAEESTDPRNHAGMLNAATNAIEKTLKQIRMMEREDTSKVTELNRLRVRELVSLVNGTLLSSAQELSEDYGIDEEQIKDTFQRNLMKTAYEQGYDQPR